MKACSYERSSTLSLLEVYFLLGSLLLLHLWTPTTIPSLIFLHSPTQNSYTMPKERGKSRRGPLNYNSLTRCIRLNPSQLALITTSNPNPSHNWHELPQKPLPPSYTPILDFGSCHVEEEILPLEEHIPLLSLHYEISPLRVHTLVHSFGTRGCIVEEEIPPSWKMENQPTDMESDLDMDVGLLE